MTTYLGVDAGASRTSAVVADGAGAVLARAEEGPGNVRPGEARLAADRIAAACRDALQRARRNAPARAIVVGAAGAGREPERAGLEAALSSAGLAERIVVTTDAAIALEAAFGGQPGIVVISGTGSIAWARLPDGTTARAGGLGPLIGDHGSGYDLGVAALRAAALALEGLGPNTTLLKRLAARVGVEPGDLPRWAAMAGVADVAALAPEVLDVAREGDAAARRIVEAGADYLARHARSLVAKFAPDTKVPVAFGGGLLAMREDYRRTTAGRLKLLVPNAEPADVPVDSPLGAIRLARALG